MRPESSQHPDERLPLWSSQRGAIKVKSIETVLTLQRTRPARTRRRRRRRREVEGRRHYTPSLTTETDPSGTDWWCDTVVVRAAK